MTRLQKLEVAEAILTAQYDEALQEVQDMDEAELDAWLRSRGIDPARDLSK